MLCDHILFWAQHQGRPVIIPGSYDEAFFNLAVSISVFHYRLATEFAPILQKNFENFNRAFGVLKNGA